MPQLSWYPLSQLYLPTLESNHRYTPLLSFLVGIDMRNMEKFDGYCFARGEVRKALDGICVPLHPTRRACFHDNFVFLKRIEFVGCLSPPIQHNIVDKV